METHTEPKWLANPEPHNYPAAASYLGLIFTPDTVDRKVQALQETGISLFKAKDIVRASRLQALGTDNAHVRKNLKKIADQKPMSPVLLVRSPETGTVIIADGYHRVSACWQHNEDTVIPAKIV